MKKTLLTIVQDILNDMDCDEVNSIDDTIESQQVANIVRQCYEEIIANRNWPHLRKVITLDSSLDVARPTYFRMPERMKELEVFRYDKQKNGDTRNFYRDVKFLYPDQFLRFTSNRNSDNDNVLVVTDPSGVKLNIYTNSAPSYWTSFDDDYIICDSHDKEVDTTLQSSKTEVVAYLEPEWVHQNDAVPDLPSEAFAMLTEESKSTAFTVVKQTTSQKAEQKATRQRIWLSRKAWRAEGGVRYDNYGRNSRK